jgi:hypothetical protein
MNIRIHALALVAVAGCAGAAVEPTEVATAPATATATAPATAPAASDDLVPFSSAESMRRLDRSRHKVDFFRLANQFEGQENGGMCGPTSAVIVLNTLRVEAADQEKPAYSAGFPDRYAAVLTRLPPGRSPIFQRYSQRGFFADPRVAAVKSEDRFYGAPGPDGKPDPGIQLRQLHDMLVALGLRSEIHVVADDTADDEVRAALVGNLARGDDYVIVNYHRQKLDQEGGGHMSPVAAYDEASDSFLVLDVNPNRGKAWAWVPARRLIGAMRTHDTIENRGYLLVSE